MCVSGLLVSCSATENAHYPMTIHGLAFLPCFLSGGDQGKLVDALAPPLLLSPCLLACLLALLLLVDFPCFKREPFQSFPLPTFPLSFFILRPFHLLARIIPANLSFFKQFVSNSLVVGFFLSLL